MWELDCEESWALKNWCFWTVLLEKTLESPLDCKEIKSVNPKGNQSLIFFGRTNAEAEILILWPPDAKCWLIGKDPDSGKVWRQEEKGMSENEIFGWHHWLNGPEFEQALEIGNRQGSLACCSPWGCKELDIWLSNWTKHMEATYMSTIRWVDKETVVHIYNGISLSPKNGMNLSQFYWDGWTNTALEGKLWST